MPIRRGNPRKPGQDEPAPTLDAKLQFLRSLGSPAGQPDARKPTVCVETHMSWIFLLGEQALKLKKPVRFPFLDFSTLRLREFYCREELRLNSRLAPGVYLGLLALQASDSGLALLPESSLPAAGQTVDWLVLMRRLPREHMLQNRIAAGAVTARDIDALVAVLGAFYRAAPKIGVCAPEYIVRLGREQAANREVLLRPQFHLQRAALALDRFDAALSQHSDLLRDRAANGWIVDGHGDLRPEHVCLLAPPVVIDCLEFNAQLRQVDPFDEVAFLALECAMAGAPWISRQLVEGCAAALAAPPEPALIELYTAHRALLRARLAMAHLLDPQPRLAQKWPPQAQRYVERALAALDALDTATPVSAATNRGNP
jgi:aminoglycoside phosphotransferase family enzyme